MRKLVHFRRRALTHNWPANSVKRGLRDGVIATDVLSTLSGYVSGARNFKLKEAIEANILSFRFLFWSFLTHPEDREWDTLKVLEEMVESDPSDASDGDIGSEINEDDTEGEGDA